MARPKKDAVSESKVETKKAKEEQTVIGLNKAEELQKAGWKLVSATRDSSNPFEPKTYIFRKE